MQKTTTWNPGLEVGIFTEWCLGFRLQFGSQSLKTSETEFCYTPCEKVIIVPDTNYITFAIRRFMLDIPYPGSFQNIDLLTWAQQGSEHVKLCSTNWVKIKGAQSKLNLHHPVVHRILIKSGKRTMMIWCILTELGTDHYFFIGGGYLFHKKIVCKP